MFPPLVLRPPHGPRIVRLLVMILAVIFYLPPASWSPITNGPEGHLAAAAQELLNHDTYGWTAPAATPLLQGPLTLWLMRLSFALFGVNEFTARLPAALGVVATVWVVLRMGERFGGIWQGFVAALILLCSPGMFSLGRVLTPLPLVAALLAATVYALHRGSKSHLTRRRWFLVAWIDAGLATLAGGWTAAAIPALTVLLLAFCYREARLRFRALLSWEGGLVFTLTLAGMFFSGFAPGGDSGIAPELAMPFLPLLCWQAGLLFPWSLLLLPAFGAVLARWWHARQPLDSDEALLLAWLAAAFVFAVADPHRTLFSTLLFWPAFAVWGALRLQTLHRRSFLGGCGLTLAIACGGLYLTQHLRELLPWLFPAKAQAFAAIPDFFWSAVTPVAFIAMLAFLLFAVAALCAEILHNRRFALLALFAAMIPAGFAFADIGAKFAPYFSDADLARCIRSQATPKRPVVLTDLSPADSCSLMFYLGPDNGVELRPRSGWIPPFFFATERSRLVYWQKNLPGRVEVLCESGEHVLLAARAE